MTVLLRLLEGVLIATTSAWLAACTGDGSSKSTVPLAPGDGSSKLTVPLARDPYIGVSCVGRPNWIACDRVGLYVYLERQVAHLRASVEGREVPMHPARGGPDARHNWEGFLHPAGLIDGPLKVKPERGRYYWFGKPPVFGRVSLTVRDDEGESATRTLRLPLAAGYG
jgi:hypothetical protein